jgi:nucleoside phosphorylase
MKGPSSHDPADRHATGEGTRLPEIRLGTPRARRSKELARSTGAVAVAWEGTGVARACQLTNVPHLEIRGITDTANHQAATDFTSNLEHAMTNIATVLHTACSHTNRRKVD